VSIEYTNRKEKRYFLHLGKTKKGTRRYYFSPKSSGDLAERIPDGYEIHEHPNGQVYLRKIEPHLITDEEIQLVERELRRRGNPGDYRMDVRKDLITVFESNQMGDPLVDLSPFFALAATRDFMEKHRTYTAILRFMIVDTANRLFVTERFCFRGSIDDWIHIGGPDALGNQAKRFISHLGKESFYELSPETHPQKQGMQGEASLEESLDV
jgi:hypothetical protein